MKNNPHTLLPAYCLKPRVPLTRAFLNCVLYKFCNNNKIAQLIRLKENSCIITTVNFLPWLLSLKSEFCLVFRFFLFKKLIQNLKFGSFKSFFGKLQKNLRFTTHFYSSEEGEKHPYNKFVVIALHINQIYTILYSHLAKKCYNTLFSIATDIAH